MLVLNGDHGIPQSQTLGNVEQIAEKRGGSPAPVLRLPSMRAVSVDNNN
jgi:hypothetical protein